MKKTPKQQKPKPRVKRRAAVAKREAQTVTAEDLAVMSRATASLKDKVLLFLTSIDSITRASVVDRVKLTKIDDRTQVETRKFTCSCGHPDCPGSGFVTLLFIDGRAATPPKRDTTIEGVEHAHQQAYNIVTQLRAEQRLEAEKDLGHALGNCECHGKDGPKA